MLQSAQDTPDGAARSSVLASEFALSLSRQAPDRTVQPGPRPDASVRLKSSLNRIWGDAVPASGIPASGEPASEAPPSGVPASGTPASGVPASTAPPSTVPPSGTPAPVPPPSCPITAKSSNQTPARLVDNPAVPGMTIADPDASVTVSFAIPFTDATSCTGPAPVAASAIVAQFCNSAPPLGAAPTPLVTPPLDRRTCSRPLPSSATSYRSPEAPSRRSSAAAVAAKFTTRACTEQSAQLNDCTTTWSLPRMSDSARVPGVLHAPATIRHAGPRPVVRLNASLNRTPDCGGGPASGGPASDPPAPGTPPSGTPASGVPPSGGGDGRGVAFGVSANTSPRLPLVFALGVFPYKHGTSAIDPGSHSTAPGYPLKPPLPSSSTELPSAPSSRTR